jgi:hypothetical protein
MSNLASAERPDDRSPAVVLVHARDAGNDPGREHFGGPERDAEPPEAARELQRTRIGFLNVLHGHLFTEVGRTVSVRATG